MKIADTNNGSIPIVDTKYYNWLVAKNKRDIHAVNTKIEYLKENGFVVGEDSISEKDLFILQSIERMYFHWVVVPTLEPLVFY